MRDDNCIFCKIANGDIPSKTLYEDEEFRVILDLGPAAKGHALILPKNHYANIYELPDETASKAMLLAKKMATVIFLNFILQSLASGFGRRLFFLPRDEIFPSRGVSFLM